MVLINLNPTAISRVNLIFLENSFHNLGTLILELKLYVEMHVNYVIKYSICILL